MTEKQKRMPRNLRIFYIICGMLLLIVGLVGISMIFTPNNSIDINATPTAEFFCENFQKTAEEPKENFADANEAFRYFYNKGYVYSLEFRGNCAFTTIVAEANSLSFMVTGEKPLSDLFPEKTFLSLDECRDFSAEINRLASSNNNINPDEHVAGASEQQLQDKCGLYSFANLLGNQCPQLHALYPTLQRTWTKMSSKMRNDIRISSRIALTLGFIQGVMQYQFCANIEDLAYYNMIPSS